MVTILLAFLAACGPEPPVWPRRFTLVQRRIPDANATVGKATTVTYYDADRGANLIQITPDAGEEVLWDLELGSHQSFYFTPTKRSCNAMVFPVGILRTGQRCSGSGWAGLVGRDRAGWAGLPFTPSHSLPPRNHSLPLTPVDAPTDWLVNATPLGPSERNGLACFGWTKVDFIDYYADALTCEPVSWYFHTMRARFDTIYYMPGLAVPNASWFTPPAYCNGLRDSRDDVVR